MKGQSQARREVILAAEDLSKGSYLTIEEAAKLSGKAKETLRNRLTLGKMTTYKFKGLTLVSALELKD